MNKEIDSKSILDKLASSIISGEVDDAKDAATMAVEKGVPIQDTLKTISMASDEVGRRFKEGEYFVTELTITGMAMAEVINILEPSIKAGKPDFAGKVVIGTVEGDIHDLGKTLVVMALTGSGFEVHDLGVDLPASTFVQKVKELKPDIVGSSALLSTTKARMKDLEEAYAKAGLKGKVKTLIGGGAVSAKYAKEIGADGYAKDCFEAVTVAKSMIPKKQKGGK